MLSTSVECTVATPLRATLSESHGSKKQGVGGGEYPAKQQRVHRSSTAASALTEFRGSGFAFGRLTQAHSAPLPSPTWRAHRPSSGRIRSPWKESHALRQAAPTAQGTVQNESSPPHNRGSR